MTVNQVVILHDYIGYVYKLYKLLVLNSN